MNYPSNMVLSAADALVLFVIHFMKKESRSMDTPHHLNVYPLYENERWMKRLLQYRKMFPIKIHTPEFIDLT